MRRRSLHALAAALIALASTAYLAPAPAAPALVASSTSGPAWTAAQAIARARVTGKPVDLAGATSPTDTVTANPNGTLTLTRHAIPVRKRVNGTWMNLDATLHRNADGTVSPVLANSELTFSGGGRSPMAVMRHLGKEFSLALPMSLPVPELAGPAATYKDVLPGVDLRLTASLQGGFSQVFIVHHAAAAANPALKSLVLSTNGLDVTAGAADGLAAVDSTGRAVFTAPAPLMWDAAKSARPKVARIGVGIAKDGIHLTPDRGVLAGPGTTYPVYIDPTWTPVQPTLGPAKAGYASVAAAFPTSNKWNNTADPNPDRLQLGWNNDPWHARTMINFQIDTATLQGATISDAHINATVAYSGSCTAAKTRVFAPTTVLTQSNATWNNWYNNIALGGEVASATFSGGYNTSCPAHAISPPFNVLGAVNAAVAASRSVQTFVFTGDTNETSDTASYKELSLASIALSITYNHTPHTPVTLTTSPVTGCTGTVSTVGDAAVMLYAQVSDPDSGTVGARFEVWKSSSPGTPIASTDPAQTPVASGSSAVLTLDPALLRAQAGGAVTEFSWHVQVWDGFATSAWSTTCKFNFDPTRPGAPGAADPPQGSTHLGEPVSVAVTKPSGSTPVRYVYQLNAGAPASVDADGAGNATITVTPARQTNMLTITAVSAGGNYGADSRVVKFTTAPRTSIAADSDFTDDGKPDLVTVGAANGLPAGVWLAKGDGVSQVDSVAANIGVNGNGVAGDNKPSNFDNAILVTGEFTGNGVQDVFAYYPSTGAGSIITGMGDGSALEPQLSGNQFTITSSDLLLRDDQDNTISGSAPVQLVNAGDSIGNGDRTADLIGYANDAGVYRLCYYFLAGPQNLQYIFRLTAKTPSNDDNWADWKIAAAQVTAGSATKTDLLLWKPSTGALYLWRDLDMSTGDLTYMSYQLKASGWGNTAPTMRAADVDRDGDADLWTVGPGGAVNLYKVSGLPSAPAIAAPVTQNLLTAAHTWTLNDKPAAANHGEVIASSADNAVSGALPLAGNSGATWNIGDLFSPSAKLNGSNGTLNTAGPALNLGNDFSVSVWVKPSGGGTVISQDGANTAGFKVWLDWSDSSWRFGVRNSDTAGAGLDTAFAPPGSAKYGVWSLLTVTYNRANQVLNLSVNGKIVASVIRGGTANFGGPFRIGAARTSSSTIGEHFAGQVARAQAWSTQVDPSTAYTPHAYPGQRIGSNLRDVNQDGFPDLLVQRANGDIDLVLGTGAVGPAGFGAALRLCTGCAQYDSATIADVDNNGTVDLFVRDKNTSEMWYYPNSASSGNPVWGTRIILCSGCSDFATPDVDDINTDGKTDLLVKQMSTGRLWIYPGVGTPGNVAWGSPVLACEGCGGYDMPSIADIDNDGKGDLVIREISTKHVYAYINNAAPGSTAWGYRLLLCAYCGVHDSIAYSDANYDGKTDFVAHRTDNSYVTIYPCTAPVGSSSWGTPFYG